MAKFSMTPHEIQMWIADIYVCCEALSETVDGDQEKFDFICDFFDELSARPPIPQSPEIAPASDRKAMPDLNQQDTPEPAARSDQDGSVTIEVAKVVKMADELAEALEELNEVQQYSVGFDNGVCDPSTKIQEAEVWHDKAMKKSADNLATYAAFKKENGL